jgi:uncharacterized membrane protein
MLHVSQVIREWNIKQLQSSHSLSFLNLVSIFPAMITSIFTILLVKKQRINIVLFKFVNHGS